MTDGTLPPGVLRLRRMAQYIRTSGFASVDELASHFGVSEMTVRRDLAALRTESLTVRARGGAFSPDAAVGIEPPFVAREVENIAAKEAIGRAAARLVCPGQTIALDVGTTTLEVARNLGSVQPLSVLTFNVHAVLALALSQATVYVPGGCLRPRELSFVGPLALDGLARFHPDIFFLSAAGIDRTRGITDYNMEEIAIKNALMARSRRVVLVADASKFDRASGLAVGPLEALHVVVTDQAPPAEYAALWEERGVEIIVASADG